MKVEIILLNGKNIKVADELLTLKKSRQTLFMTKQRFA